MSDHERTKLVMYESVISFLSENRDIVSNIRSFSYSITRLKKMVDSIKTKEKELSSDILEKTIISSKIKEELIFTLIPVAAALFTFAKENGNIALKERARCTQSYYLRLKDRELIDKAEGLLVLAERNSDKLKKFRIKAGILKELKMKIELFRMSLEKKINSFISSDMVMMMNDLFIDADKICSSMDSYVELLSDNYSEFYDDYLITRSLDAYDQKRELLEIEEEEE